MPKFDRWTTKFLQATTPLSWLIPVAVCLSGLAVAERPPNVVIVMTDDQGYGEFSCHGNPITKTPNIDRLAEQSVRLTDFHVAPMCTPTRGQLLSGLDAFKNSAINVSSGRTLLSADLTTLADIFRQAGYRTGIFGKWHLGDNYPFRPEDRGFDEALWFPSSHINSVPDYWDNDYFDDTYIRNGKRQAYSGYCTDLFFDEAVSWMQEDKSRPFFSFIPLNAAHFPWFIPDHYRTDIRKAVAEHPDHFKAFKNKPKRLNDLISFLAMGANIDDNIGKLESFLQDQGLAENTVVIFLTDNGSTFGQDYFNAGMRGKKTQLWEGGHRVPCFIRWPAGGLGQPRDIDTLCHVQDLMPTLADMAGATQHLPENLDGTSLVPLLHGDKHSLDERMLVINYSRMPGFKVTYTDGNPAVPNRDGAAVLWKKWRFLENRQLFNVETDPHQDQDVASEHPEIVQKLGDRLATWWDSVKDDVNTPQRVVIGSEFENPMMLTACEWLDVFVDQQLQVRLGQNRNGVWYLIVDQPGTYRFELRRWPRESGVDLISGVEPTTVTDGKYLPGRSLPISEAKIRIGDHLQTAKPNGNKTACIFELALEEGPVELQTWFLDAAGKELCGAYYVYVQRL